MGGVIRAQAFVKSFRAGQTKETFDARIAILQGRLAAEKSEIATVGLKAELQALESFKKSQ